MAFLGSAGSGPHISFQDPGDFSGLGRFHGRGQKLKGGQRPIEPMHLKCLCRYDTRREPIFHRARQIAWEV